MSALTERLALLISADVKGATRGLSEVGKASKQHLGDAEKRVDKMGQTFSKVGGVMLGVGAAGAVGLFKLAGAAEEARKVTRQTDAVLKSMGDQANVTASEVGKLAGAISAKTGIDHKAIQSSENLLLTFGNLRNEVGEGNDIFTRATKLTTDMSVSLGQDLKSSAIQLGKALNDPIKGITALSRVGVSFTQQQKDQVKALVDSGDALEAQKLILTEVERQFKGSAEAQATAIGRSSSPRWVIWPSRSAARCCPRSTASPRGSARARTASRTSTTRPVVSSASSRSARSGST